MSASTAVATSAATSFAYDCSVLTEQLHLLRADLARTMMRDRHALARRLNVIERAITEGKPVDHALARLDEDVRGSLSIGARRAQRLPKPAFPPELPVSQR